MIRYALLWLLRDAPDYGYSMHRRFEERLGPAWQLNIGQVYQTLRSLETAGLVRQTGKEIGPRHRVRRLFEITPAGRAGLERWLRRPFIRPRPAHDDGVLRLLLLEAGRNTEALAHIRGREEICRRHHARLLRARQRRPAGGEPPVRTIRMLSEEAALLALDAHLRWLALCTERLGRLLGEAREGNTTTMGAGPGTDRAQGA